MPSTTSCSDTFARNATMCAPSACHRPCVRQRRSPTQPTSPSRQRVRRVSSSTACMISSMWIAAGRPRQHVAAGAAARACHQAGAPQPQKDLLEVGQRQALPLGNGRERNGGDRAILGEIGHGHHRVPGLGVQLHATSSTAATPAACGRFLLQSAPGRVLRSATVEEPGRVNPARALSNGSKVYRNMKIPSPQVKVSAWPIPRPV